MNNELKELDGILYELYLSFVKENNDDRLYTDCINFSKSKFNYNSYNSDENIRNVIFVLSDEKKYPNKILTEYILNRYYIRKYRNDNEKLNELIQKLKNSTFIRAKRQLICIFIIKEKYKINRNLINQSLLEEILKKCDRDAKLFHWVGFIYQNIYNNPILAQKYYLKALEIDPLSVNSFKNLGILYKSYRDYEQSLYYYNKYIIYKYEPTILFDIGLVYKFLNNPIESNKYIAAAFREAKKNNENINFVKFKVNIDEVIKNNNIQIQNENNIISFKNLISIQHLINIIYEYYFI